VHEVARQLGYLPNDRAREMAARRWRRNPEHVIPLALLHSPWQDHSPLQQMFAAVEERAAQLGYRSEHFILRGGAAACRTLQRSLLHRNITHVLAHVPADASQLEIDWQHLTGVLIGADAPSLRLSRILQDWSANYALALDEAFARGYHRPGFALYRYPGEAENARHLAPCLLAGQRLRQSGSAALPIHMIEPMRASEAPMTAPVEEDLWRRERTRLRTWMSKHAPDVVITNSCFTLHFFRDLGLQPPSDCGLIVMRCSDFPDHEGVAGIALPQRVLGWEAVNLLDRLRLCGTRGFPEAPLHVTLAGRWREGYTVRPVAAAAAASF